MYLQKGMRVKMSPRGESRWPNSTSNPHDMYGVLDSVDSEEEKEGEAEYEDGFEKEENYSPYWVVWDNGQCNSYRWLDLQPILPDPDKTLEDYL